MTPSVKKMAGKEIPFSTEKGGVFPAGQLLVASDEGSFDAFVVNFSFPETEKNKKRNGSFLCEGSKYGVCRGAYDGEPLHDGC